MPAVKPPPQTTAPHCKPPPAPASASCLQRSSAGTTTSLAAQAAAALHPPVCASDPPPDSDAEQSQDSFACEEEDECIPPAAAAAVERWVPSRIPRKNKEHARVAKAHAPAAANGASMSLAKAHEEEVGTATQDLHEDAEPRSSIIIRYTSCKAKASVS